MTTMNLDAILGYTLVPALAVSAGLAFAVASGARRNWPSWTAGFIITIVVIVAGFASGTEVVWIGPVFALVTMATHVFASANIRRDDPVFAGRSYGERVRLVLSPRYVRAAVEASQEDHIRA